MALIMQAYVIIQAAQPHFDAPCATKPALVSSVLEWWSISCTTDCERHAMQRLMCSQTMLPLVRAGHKLSCVQMYMHGAALQLKHARACHQ